MEYNKLVMQRLINNNKRLATLFLEQSKGSKDYGLAASKNVFETIVIKDKELSKAYLIMIGEEPEKHEIRETPITKSIEWLIEIHGWKNFIAGLALFAKNKESRLKAIGLREEVWSKIIKITSNIPKNPQF